MRGRPALNLQNKIFGRLKVISRNKTIKKEGSWWNCICSCGNLTIRRGSDLVAGNIRSCGCLLTEWRKEKGKLSATHHYSRKGNKTYTVWCAMRTRCRDKNNPNYGGRGIKICKRWNNFINFLTDMGEVPTGLSIDRYPNNDGDYEPGNCRWATPKQQANNRRKRKKKYVQYP